MLQKKRSSVVEDKLDAKRKQIIEELSEKYDYTESIENGRIVLRHKRLTFVEIKDTQDDREKYKFIVDNYVEYVKKSYNKEATCIHLDIEKSFNQEVLQPNKLPLFFVYNKNDILIGTCGFRHSIELEVDSGKAFFHEVSIRIIDSICGEQRYFGYGAISFLVIYLYAMRKNKRIYVRTFHKLRDAMFKGIDNFTHFHYIGSKNVRYMILDNEVFVDFFIDDKHDIVSLDKLISCDI